MLLFGVHVIPKWRHFMRVHNTMIECPECVVISAVSMSAGCTENVHIQSNKSSVSQHLGINMSYGVGISVS